MIRTHLEELVKDHYWDSLEKDRDLIIKHFVEGIIPLALHSILQEVEAGLPKERFLFAGNVEANKGYNLALSEMRNTIRKEKG